MLQNFIAFDFETANQNRRSICSVGLTFVENGKIVDTLYSLINPEEPFSPFNIQVHGIQPTDVKHAPTFDVFYHSIRHRIRGTYWIAHNLSFDGYALHDVLQKYNVTPEEKRLLCSYQLTRRLEKNFESYSLNYVARALHVPLQQHHHALDDAIACAHIVNTLVEKHELYDEEAFLQKTGIIEGVMNPFEFRTSKVATTKKGTNIATIAPNKSADTTHPLYGKNIVFTGKLQNYTRKQAALLVANKGGSLLTDVSPTTHIVVLGNSTIQGKKSSKLVKIEQLMQKGHPITILSEEEFLGLVR